MSKLYAASMLALKIGLNCTETHHKAGYCYANNQDEALGLAYRYVLAVYPAEDSYYNHSVALCLVSAINNDVNVPTD
jgi:hypothetical protein